MIVSNPNLCISSIELEAHVVRGVNFVFPGLVVTVLAMVSACTLTPSTPESVAAKQEHAQVEQQARVPNEYLVTLAPDISESVIPEYYGRFGIKYLHALGDETFLLVLSDDPGPHEMEVLIQDESRIKVVQPNLIYWDYR